MRSATDSSRGDRGTHYCVTGLYTVFNYNHVPDSALIPRTLDKFEDDVSVESPIS